MLIKRPKGWEIPESQATPEHVFLNRRSFLAGSAVTTGAIGLGGLGVFSPTGAAETDPTADLYPAPRSDKYMVTRELTSEDAVTSYNNFYEFGSSKSISEAAQALPLRPWQVTLDGMVEEEMTVDIDSLIRRMQLEERVYRFRCVEAWAMTVPWTGFAMSQLVEMARPLSGAKYVRMETFEDADIAPGQRQFWYPWPYVEGLTIEEAMNDMTLLVTGVYGKPALPQNGAPLRLITPWKFGFKSIKSIVRFTFTDERPKSFWEELQDSEYGFWANVNPEVPHPRWSQAQERVINEGPSYTWEKVPTQLYNGYGEFVADLYKDMEGENLFM
jgi:sulfoxide reductase catalytic subunit YedY